MGMVVCVVFQSCAFLNSLEDPPESRAHCIDEGDCLEGRVCDDGLCVEGDGPSSCEAAEVPAGLVCVSPGTFEVGSPDTEIGRDNRHEVLHEVRISRAFFVQETEVTQAQWQQVMALNPSLRLGCPQCPVETVNWWEALEYLNARSRMEGLEVCYERFVGCEGQAGEPCQTCPEKLDCVSVSFKGVSCTGWRLPTEAEWEVAARAGTATAFFTGEISDEDRDPLLDAVAWYESTSGGESHQVGEKASNGFGLRDTSGNVSEWVWDGFGVYPTGSQVDPTGPSEGFELRVVRGGGWQSVSRLCRSASRDIGDPGLASPDLGFRPVRTVP